MDTSISLAPLQGGDVQLTPVVPPLRPEELAGLEASILEHGVMDALKVWPTEFGDVLLDGHNRYAIAEKHGLPYEVQPVAVDGWAEARIWILDNQLGRRNLTDEQHTYLLGARYEAESWDIGDNQHTRVRHYDEPSGATHKRLAKENGVSASTVERAAKYKQAVDAIAGDSEELKNAILAGKVASSKKDVMQFAGVMKKEPTLGKAAVDEVAAGNAKSFKQAMAYVRKEERHEEAQALPDAVFNVIYADPPWEYSNSGLEGSAAKHYPTMKTSDICELLETIDAQIADNAVLFLWVTNPLLVDGLRVLKAWGFEYKTNLVWVKPYVNRGKSGWYVQGHHELLLIAARGKCTPQVQPQSVTELPRTEHSTKPDEFRYLIERMYPGYNYLELFARNQPPRNGWVFWGNEQ
ncbi:MAG: MT-A70 family methyltransferase [Planctomycetota bacterium]|jgi:N6-adenosine-specific RNA methylase IME4